MTTQPNETKTPLHFIGKKLYTKQLFEEESINHGVQRALPFHQLKKLNFGDTVLLAQQDQKTKKSIIFGYFIITGLNHTLPQETIDQLKPLLKISSTQQISTSISRACGFYSIGTSIEIKNTLPELCKIILELNIPVNAYKWFLTGTYCPLKTPITTDKKFTRGLTTCDIKIPKQKTKSPYTTTQIYNYRKRSSIPKKMQKSLKQKSIFS